MLDLNRLVTFAAVVEAGSFTAAAQTLHITQPAVSRQVALLERQLRTRLVTRDRAGLEPTPTGEVLLEHTRAVMDRLSLAEQQVRAMVGSHTGQVRLGSFFSALVQLSAEVASAVAEQHPDLRIIDDLVDPNTALAKLGRGDLDAAIVFGYDFAPLPVPDGVTVEMLFDDPVRIVLPAGHQLAGQPIVDPALLAGDTWIQPTDGGGAEVVERVLTAHRLDPPRLRIGHGDEPVELQALVAAGRGVMVAHELTVMIEPSGIAVRPITSEAGYRRVGVAYADGPRSAAADAVLATVREVGRRRQPEASVS